MKNNQRGGIVSFAVVTLALIGLLAGGLYLSKTQARQANNGNGTTEQVAKDDSKEGAKAPAEQKPAAEPKGAEEAKPTPTAPAAPATPAKPAPTTQSTNRVANTGPSADIPATGPADVFMYVFGLGALAFTSYQLVQSRRLVRQNALKR